MDNTGRYSAGVLDNPRLTGLSRRNELVSRVGKTIVYEMTSFLDVQLLFVSSS